MNKVNTDRMHGALLRQETTRIFFVTRTQYKHTVGEDPVSAAAENG